jgi:DNA-binding transcriptional LysR family regulator
VGKAFGLKRVTLNQLFVPSSEGQVRAVLAGWGVSILPELLVRGLLEQGSWSTSAPAMRCPSSCTGIAGTWNPTCSTPSVPRSRARQTPP